MNKPINRTTVQVENNKYRVYPKAAPLFYKKADGSYGDIDHTFNDTTSSIGDISLMDKGVVSVGKRKGNNPHKVVGIRPDNNQHLGTQQLEFSLVNVELDGESQDFNVEDDLEIKLRASKVFQLVKINKDFNNFKIEFDIHSKGLDLQNTKYTEATTIRNYGFNLNNIGVDSGDNIFNNFYNNLSSSSLDKDIPYIDIHIAQVSDSFITKGEYTNEEEFGYADLSNYNIRDMYGNGSAVYLKDSIVVYCKSVNIDSFEQVMINKFKRLFNAEFYDDGGSGKYFTINDEKIGGIAVKSETDFLAFFNTKEINQNIKDLFIRKTFNSTSFIDIALDNFEDKINSCFNVDLKLEVNSDYYEPIDNKFIFNINKETMHIGLPMLFDEDYNHINIETRHTLKDNEDGSYRYTKYFSTDGFLNKENNIKYIDATLYVSESDDNWITYSYNSSAGQKKTSSNFATARNASTGTVASGGLSNAAYRATGDNGNKSTTSNQFGPDTVKYSWIMQHSFFLFDSSDISDNVTDLDWVMKAAYFKTGSSHNDISVILLKSDTEGGQATSNWNDFVGHTSGWGASDVTEYSAEYVVDGYEDTSTNFVSNNNKANYVTETVSLNSDAKSDIEDNATFKFGIVDYDQQYSNSLDTSYGVTATGGRMMNLLGVDDSTTSNRPYLEYTTGEAEESVTYNSVFFGSNF